MYSPKIEALWITVRMLNFAKRVLIKETDPLLWIILYVEVKIQFISD